MDETLTNISEETPELTPSPTPIPDYFSEFEIISEELFELNSELDTLKESTQDLQYQLEIANGFLEYQAGFGLFFVIVVLCYFVHKFFKMFF